MAVVIVVTAAFAVAAVLLLLLPVAVIFVFVAFYPREALSRPFLCVIFGTFVPDLWIRILVHGCLAVSLKTQQRANSIAPVRVHLHRHRRVGGFVRG